MVAAVLALAVFGDAFRMLLAILALVVAMGLPPLVPAVTARLGIDRIAALLVCVIVGAAFVLASLLAANTLTQAIAGRLEQIPAMGAENKQRDHISFFPCLCSQGYRVWL